MKTTPSNNVPQHQAPKTTSRRLVAGLFIAVTLCLALGTVGVHFVMTTGIADDIGTQKTNSVRPLTLADVADMPPLKVGDLVFRWGFGTESSLIVRAQSEARAPYSHVGMVTKINPVVITHATTTDDPQHRDQVIQSSLEAFLQHGHRFGVKRPHWSDDIKAQSALRAEKRLGTPFQLSPDNPDALYCTTLVTQSLLPDLVLDVPRDLVDVPVIGGHYLMPAALWEHPGMTTLYER